MNYLLEIQHLNFKYHKKMILQDISFTLNKGEIIAIIGPSGAGKSTLLRSIAMLTPPNEGKIIFRDKLIYSSRDSIRKQDILNYKRAVGIVFQELYLWPHLTVIENIILPLVQGKGMKEHEAKAKAEDLLVKLSLESFAKQYPMKLSVGQQQRCAIARTLAMDPAILLLDEITSALDPELVASILKLIKDIAANPNRTLLVVTHEMEFAKKASDRIIYLEGGKLIAIGTFSELSNNVDSRIARFLSNL